MRSTLLAAAAVGLALPTWALHAQPTPWPGDAGVRPLKAPGGSHRPLTWNLAEPVLPLFNALEAGGRGELAIIGDSISFQANQYNWFLKALFEGDYGSGGEGFLSPSGMNGDCKGAAYVRCGISLNRSIGAGTSLNTGSRDPRCYGLDVDGNYGTLGFVGGIHGQITTMLYGDTATVHYVKEQGAGSFGVYVAGQLVAVLDASTDGPSEHASVTVQTNSPNPDWLTQVKVKHIDGGQVFIDGFEMSRNGGGFVYHRLARGGVGPDDFLNGLGEPTRAFLEELDPDLVFLMLDWSSSSWFFVFEEQTNALLDFYEAAMPDARFILVTHHAFKAGIASEADWYLQIAHQRGHGYINLFDLHSGLGELTALGFMADEVHMSAAGGAWFGQYIYDLLTEAAHVGRTADHDRDDQLDVNDLLAYFRDFAGRAPAADLDGDGAVDAADLADYLNAFARAMR